MREHRYLKLNLPEKGAYWARGSHLSIMLVNSGQCGLQPTKRLLRPHLAKLVKLFEDGNVFAEWYPSLLAAREDLYIWRALIWIIQSPDTHISQLAEADHMAAENGNAAIPASANDLALSARCRKFMFRDRSFELDPVRLNDGIQDVGGSGLPLALATVAAVHEHR